MRILADFKEERAPCEWQKEVDYRPEISGSGTLPGDILSAFRLLRLGGKYDVVVVSGSRRTSIYAVLAGLRPGGHPPIIMIDCLWYKPGNPILHFLKKIQLGLMARSISRFVVWASHEVRCYAETFGLPEGKFIFLPHHHTLEGYDFETRDGGYLFSGGDGDRDYGTLLKAVAGLGMKVVIATRRRDWHGGEPVPEGISVVPTGPADFRKLMAGARLVVVPMAKGLLHSGGQQTYLNAMAMGKPVIVGDDRGAADYIASGMNGLIVHSGDAAALRSAILRVVGDAGFAARLSENARRAFDEFSTPKCLRAILRLAKKTAEGAANRGRGGARPEKGAAV